ncbi:MAG: chemotaxis protein CheW [Burkholderiales bacterium]|nr:chemotaxis protein CheW [Burkholderiales bacterium]
MSVGPLAASPAHPLPAHGGAPAEQTASRLGMQLGDEHWLLDLDDVSEVMPVPELVPVPLTKPWFAGLASVRGALVSVVDFGAFLGAGPAAASERARLVLIAEKHRIMGALLFSGVVGLRQLDRFVREPDEAQQPAWIQGYYRDEERRRWAALYLPALVADPDFLAVEL